ncbi:unnamed protein product [Linum trigynum]|uniref:Uncharacterized protein n=1 Tax=Linum trigynum TaxID=586398 RepID=A0AAV2CSU3_9ROSI
MPSRPPPMMAEPVWDEEPAAPPSTPLPTGEPDASGAISPPNPAPSSPGEDTASFPHNPAPLLPGGNASSHPPSPGLDNEGSSSPTPAMARPAAPSSSPEPPTAPDAPAPRRGDRQRQPSVRLRGFDVDLPGFAGSTTTTYPIEDYLTYQRLSQAHHAFVAAVTSHDEPRFF